MIFSSQQSQLQQSPGTTLPPLSLLLNLPDLTNISQNQTNTNHKRKEQRELLEKLLEMTLMKKVIKFPSSIKSDKYIIYHSNHSEQQTSYLDCTPYDMIHTAFSYNFNYNFNFKQNTFICQNQMSQHRNPPPKMRYGPENPVRNFY